MYELYLETNSLTAQRRSLVVAEAADVRCLDSKDTWIHVRRPFVVIKGSLDGAARPISRTRWKTRSRNYDAIREEGCRIGVGLWRLVVGRIAEELH